MDGSPSGYGGPMTDYSAQGAIPVEDAAVDHPPTVDEVAAEQERRYPEQAATRQGGAAPPAGGPVGSPEKDPEDWTTGDEPMTGAQASYLHTLARDAGVEVDDTMTKADASRLIDELRSRTGRTADR